jgi:hypothetical protein
LAAPFIKQAALYVHSEFISNTKNDFVSKYKGKISMFHNLEYALRLFDLHKQGNSLVCFLLASAALERSLGVVCVICFFIYFAYLLGDYLWVVKEKNVTIPRKLRLVLDASIVSRALGEPVNLFFKALCGPLQGLNKIKMK